VSRPPDLTILNVGRLAPVKGQVILVRATAALRERGYAVRTVLVGEGPARSFIEREVGALGLTDRVTLMGAVGQDEIRAVYAAADAFCLPSFAEGLPVVLMEAMAMALPVVTTPIAGIPELVRHDVEGLLVRPGRVDELAEALRRVAGDRELRARLGAAGQARVTAEYDVRANAAGLGALFERYVGSRGAVDGDLG
jgi:glycosyltransferase involved in cell wall biosynthesis